MIRLAAGGAGRHWSMLVAAGLCLGLGSLRGQEPPRPTDRGVAIGQPAPRFVLQDSAGREHSLESLLAKGPVALVFHRSADW